MNGARELLEEMLARRLPGVAAGWLGRARAEVARGVEPERFSAHLSLASRHAPHGAFAPSEAETSRAAQASAGWNPERWTTLDAVRALLVLSRTDLPEPTLSQAIEEAFRYADVGEMVALHRSLQLLPSPERFVWRAGEGCRSSIRAVFEAAACDTGFPAANFDDLAFRQLAIKALFVEAPLWRVHGLDARLDAELARMALDLAEERRSAGRNVQPELWLCLGRHGGERGLRSIEQELAGSNTLGRRAAAIALARAGATKRLAELLERERDPAVAGSMLGALEGKIGQTVFRELDPTRQ
ncbi:MAG: EboA domain-containing protein [Planctomycetota bacterium]